MERMTRFRVHIMLGLIALVLGFFLFQMFQSQVVETGGKPSDNMTTFVSMTRVKAARGDILDRNGNILVGNRASYDLVINYLVLLYAEGTNDYVYQMTNLCKELGVAYNDHFPVSKDAPFAYTLADYNADYQQYFQQFLAKLSVDSDITAPLLMQTLRRYYSIPDEWSDAEARAVIGVRYELSLRGLIQSLPNYVFINDASDEARSAILELNVPGMNVESSVYRYYNTVYAAHILGSVGKMSPEQWETYQDQGYAMDAEVGQSGLELAFEEYLHGTDGTRWDVVSVDGTVIESYYDPEPKAGNNVEITIDINLQGAAERAMEEHITKLRSQGEEVSGSDIEGTAAVAMDPRNGEVLVCASYPTYDLATLSEKWDEVLAIPYNALFNRALDAAYPPGSTYKIVTTIAAIENHVISSGSVIVDKGAFTRYADEGLTIYCMRYNDGLGTHGPLDVMHAIEVSCNYFFYELGYQLPLGALDPVAKAMGLGESTGIELPEEIGHRANTETKHELYGETQDFYRVDQVLAAIGQSDNRFTPMQLCVYVSTLANRGTRYKATFLRRVVSADYRQLVFENSAKILSQYEISDDAYLAYMQGMYRAANEVNGSTFDTMGYLPFTVCAKTGTAQTGTVGSDNGACIAFAPMDAPEIAVSVYGEHAGYGSSLAAVATNMLESYFGNAGNSAEVTTFENYPN